MLKAVLFDLDGVITDTAKFHFLAWRDLGAELGVTVDEAFNEELKGVSRIDSLERILAFGGLADKYSTAEKEALCTKKNDHYLELIQEMTPADILPGILPLLEELREAGLKAIVTSASKNAPVQTAATTRQGCDCSPIHWITSSFSSSAFTTPPGTIRQSR